MPFKFLEIIKLLGNSGSIARTIQQAMHHFNGGGDSANLNAAMKEQAQLNIKFENQLKLLQEGLIAAESMMKKTRAFAYTALFLTIVNLIILLIIIID